MILYRAWSAIGVPVIALVYPLVLFGAFIRFQTRRIGRTATSLGLVGVVVLSLLVWGGLAALARFQLDLIAGGFLTIALAGGVATLSAALALGAYSVDGRVTTRWLLASALAPVGLADFFSRTFELEGAGYLIMWLAISFPIGWVLGLLVTLADVVRPTG